MKIIIRTFFLSVVFFGGIFLSEANLLAATLFFDDFESGSLSQWVGLNGGANHGLIVADPRAGHLGNNVLTFTQLGSGGDIFTAASFPSPGGAHFQLMLEDFVGKGNSVATCALGCAGNVTGDVFFDNIRIEDGPGGSSVVSFDYFGDPTKGGTPGNLGGFAGYSYGTSNDFLNNPRNWLFGTTSCCGGRLNLLSGVPPAAVLVDAGVIDPTTGAVTTHLSASFTPVPVPEPGTLLLISSGIVGLFAVRKRTRLA